MICSLQLNLRESQCKELQKTAFNTLLGDQPTHVASFGNSDVNSVGEWVKILNIEPENEVAFDANTPCVFVHELSIPGFLKRETFMQSDLTRL